MAQHGPNGKQSARRTRKKKLTRKSVLKMLAVMEAQCANPGTSASASPATPEGATHAQEFLSTGRTGRRNALPDILSQHAIQVTSSDLPSKLQALSTSDVADDAHNKPGTSKS